MLEGNKEKKGRGEIKRERRKEREEKERGRKERKERRRGQEGDIQGKGENKRDR